jgi:HEAT repeat protein
MYMSHLKMLLIAAALALAAGCGPTAPTSAGGMPVSHWVEELRDPNPNKRKEAAEKLGNVGAADPTAVPALVGALKDSNARVRGAAVLALGKPGSTAKAAVPTLQDLKDHDPDPGVRDYAAKALKNIAGG